MTTNSDHHWRGQIIKGDCFALTVQFSDGPVHRRDHIPVLAAAGTIEAQYILQPDQIGAFILAHQDRRLVCAEIGHLHFALVRHLGQTGAISARDALWTFVRESRVDDLLLLDMLLAMAEWGDVRRLRSFPEAARARLPDDLPVPEIPQAHQRGQSETNSLTDPGPILRSRVVVMCKLHGRMLKEADAISRALNSDDELEVDLDSVRLSLGVQVRGAVALANAAYGDGLRLRRDVVTEILNKCDQKYREASRVLNQNNAARRCFKWEGSPGDRLLVRQDKSSRPIDYRDRLERWLKSILLDSLDFNDIPLDPPLTAPGRIATSSSLWGEILRYHPLLRSWANLENAAYISTLLNGRRRTDEPLHPRYEPLPEISSTNPGIEALRGIYPGPMFEPANGEVFLRGTLCDLALRFLADDCSDPDGASSLLEVFRKGIDPAAYAAAALAFPERLGEFEPLQEQLDQLRSKDESHYHGWTTIARNLLHAALRGLSVDHAHELIRSELEESVTQVDLFQAYDRIRKYIFPELEYLVGDRTRAHLEEWLGREANIEESHIYIREEMDKPLKDTVQVRRVLSGNSRDPKFMSMIRTRTDDPDKQAQLAGPAGCTELYDAVFRTRCATGMGRIRGRLEKNREWVAYLHDAADDLRKTVFFELVVAGYNLVAIAGDDFIISVPGDRSSAEPHNSKDINVIKSITEEVMSQYLSRVPSRCEVKPVTIW